LFSSLPILISSAIVSREIIIPYLVYYRQLSSGDIPFVLEDEESLRARGFGIKIFLEMYLGCTDIPLPALSSSFSLSLSFSVRLIVLCGTLWAREAQCIPLPDAQMRVQITREFLSLSFSLFGENAATAAYPSPLLDD